MFPEQFKSLKLISECPVCRQKHFPAEIRLIEERPAGHLLHVRCKNCQSCLVVLMSFGEQGMNMIGILTDFGSEEVLRFFESEPLKADQILEARAEILDKNFSKKIMSKPGIKK